MRNSLLIAFLAFGFGCAPDAERDAREEPFEEPAIHVEAEEREVARRALEGQCWRPSRSIQPGQVVVDRLDWNCGGHSSTIDELAQRLRQKSAGDERLAEAVEDFLRKAEDNIRSQLLVGEIEGLELVSARTLDSLTKPGADGVEGNFWTCFAEAYPKSGGYWRISRVGLSVDRCLAVVAVSSVGGSLMGSGQVEVYELIDGQWQASEKDLGVRWIS